MYRRLISAAAAVTAFLGLAATAQAADRHFCNTYSSGGKTVLFLIDQTSGSKSAKMLSSIEAARKYLLGSIVSDPARAERKIVGGAVLEPGQFLHISSISDAISNRKVIYQDCRPGRESGLATIFERPVSPVILQQHEEDFLQQASTALAKATANAKPAKKSAIIDTLSKLTHEYPAGSIAKVVIVSDMLDNLTVNLLPKHDNVRGLTDFLLQEALRTVASKRAFANLRNTEVVVFGFGIDDADRTPLDPDASRMVENFWNGYLQRSEAQGGLKIKH